MESCSEPWFVFPGSKYLILLLTNMNAIQSSSVYSVRKAPSAPALENTIPITRLRVYIPVLAATPLSTRPTTSSSPAVAGQPTSTLSPEL